MARLIPPLRSLAAFEAAGRLLSFAAAADELGVTPSAVSHQIKLLEEQVGYNLFERSYRKVELTEYGEIFFNLIRQGFDIFDEATRRLGEATEFSTVSVSVESSFATKFLQPRLRDFSENNPNIELRLITRPWQREKQVANADVAIAFGPRPYQGLLVENLMDEEVFPVCAPQMLDEAVARFNHIRAGGRDDPAGRIPLIHDETISLAGSFPDWSMWAEANGMQGLNTHRGMHFNLSHLVLQAAVEGTGVALGRANLASADLSAGRLTRLPFASFPTIYSYFIVTSEAIANIEAVDTFIRWLKRLCAEHGLQKIDRQDAASRMK